jgi:hypothetical protein
MDLLDRYLQAVKKHLPLSRQDDIIAELRANMESQLEDKESALGRPMTLGESEDWLRQMGSPIQVAMQYQPQQYLIGPSIFPMYLYVIRTALLWATIIYSVVSAVVIATQTPTGIAVLQALLRLPWVLLNVIAWITLAFAAFEFAATRFPEKCPPIAGFYAKWSPSELPPVEPPSVPGRKRRSYTQAVAEIVFGFLFLGWFVLVPQNPYLMFGPGVAYLKASPFQLADAWMTIFWWIVGLNLVQLIWRCIDLWRGSWQQTGSVQHMVVKVFAIIPLWLMAGIPNRAYILLRHPEVDQLTYGGKLEQINNGIHLGLQLLCAITILQLAWNVAQMIFANYRKHQSVR